MSLLAKALAAVILPVFIGGSLLVPKDYNTPISYDGTYKGYSYEARLTKNPDMNNYQASRVNEITINQNGKTIARFSSRKGWEVLYSENRKDVLELVKTLDDDMKRKYPYKFRGI